MFSSSDVGKWRFHISKDDYGHAMEAYLRFKTDRNTFIYYYINEGQLLAQEIGVEGYKLKDKPKPFFIFDVYDEKQILHAISEGLKEIGIVPEVDNKERITAQAVAEEREKELEYFKDINTKLIDSIVNRQDKDE